MKQVDFKKAIVDRSESTLTAISILDSTDFHIVLVVDENQKLLGTITDGDIRRAILRGVNTSDTVECVYNKKPIHATKDMSHHDIRRLMQDYFVKQIPILDDGGRVIGLKLSDDFLESHKDVEIVLMVGGLGTRLKPLTETCPKPMLKVGDKPILERIIMQFQKQGFTRINLAVNYKAHMVEEYFRDGSDWGVTINYIKEQASYGTAGALALLDPKPTKPFLVMNGDLLTSADFNELVSFHYQTESIATMSIREYHFQVPYGVVKMSGTNICEFIEKPEQKFFVNSGIYVLNPEALNYIPKDTKFDMPSLFSAVKNDGGQISGFPLREYWLDIGKMDDFKRAEKEYRLHFPE